MGKFLAVVGLGVVYGFGGLFVGACSRAEELAQLAAGAATECSETLVDGSAKPFCYRVLEGRAIYQGDILIDVKRRSTSGLRAALTMKGEYLSTHLWDGGKIPYTIDPALTDPSRIEEAVDQFHRQTPIRWIPRTTETDYITFRPISGVACYSWIGRIGGEQFIDLDPTCGVPETVHEMGHAVGLWHEQGRSDRDAFVNVLYDNILPEFVYAFDEDPFVSENSGPYDFHSVMHYPPTAFSKNGRPTIERKDGTNAVGPGLGLSAGDAEAIARLYGGSARPDGDGRVRLNGIPGVIAAAPADGYGKVALWNAETLAPLGELNPFPQVSSGIAVAIGDLDADGVLDVVAAATRRHPRIVVISGRTGSRLADFFPLGVSPSGSVKVAVGDVDGDGRENLLLVTGSAAVRVYPNLPRDRDFEFTAFEGPEARITSMASADLDGDGRAEILLGSNGGEVRTYRIETNTATLIRRQAGSSVAAGYLDSDDYADLVIGFGGHPFARFSSFAGPSATEPLTHFRLRSRAIASTAVTRVAGDGAIVVGAFRSEPATFRVLDREGKTRWKTSLRRGKGANVAAR